jgi:HD-like signal output (HDOD) protein
MSTAEVYAQIEKMGELPSLPRTLLRIQEVAQDDRSSADDLAECILRDQSLTLRVLKVVNSAMYRGSRTDDVSSVSRAVIRMGFETVRRLALGLSVFDMMSKLSRSPWLAEIARHSLVTAGFAQALARVSGAMHPEEAGVMGLVHDVGKIVLLECSPSLMDAVLEDERRGTAYLEAERAHFGIGHARAGRRLAARWQLPPELQQAIGDHHDVDPLDPPRTLEPWLAIITYADALARCAEGSEPGPEQPRIINKAGKLLGIPSARRDDIVPTALGIIDELARVLGIETGDLRRYGSLVNLEGGVLVAPPTIGPDEMAVRTARQLELYQAVGWGIGAGTTAEDLLQMIVDGAADILGFERVVMLRVDRAARTLRPWVWSGIGADDLAPWLGVPLARESGAVALAALHRRAFHVPMAHNAAYGELAGKAVLSAARCTGFAVTPVLTPAGVPAVIYGDGGPDGADILAEQATELEGLAVQAGLVLSAPERTPVG